MNVDVTHSYIIIMYFCVFNCNFFPNLKFKKLLTVLINLQVFIKVLLCIKNIILRNILTLTLSNKAYYYLWYTIVFY